MKKVLNLLLMVWIFSSCSWDNEETLYGNDVNTPDNPIPNTCDVTQVTYVLSVAPIIDYNCNSCHGAKSASFLGDGIVLDDYSHLKRYASNGKLMGTVNHSKGYKAMPQNGSKLTSCEILTIQTWLDDGTLNN